LGFGKRGDYIDAHVLPAGFVSSVEGQAVLLHGELNAFSVLALINSRLFQFLINMYCGQHKYPGYVHLLPEPAWLSEAMVLATSAAASAYGLKESFESADETSPMFFHQGTSRFWQAEFIERASKARAELHELEMRVNSSIFEAYELSESAKDLILKDTSAEPTTGGVLDQSITKFWSTNLFHFLLGCIYGRWDVRCVNAEQLPQRYDAFAALPSTPPAWLDSSEPESEYPIEIIGFGIMSADESFKNSFSKHLSDVLKYIYAESADEMELVIARQLGFSSLRAYLSDDIGFFADHLEKYSKGRRQAPIYWPISTASGGFTLWIYYPSLTSQTLYTAVNDFVEPKLRQVARDVAALREKGSARSRDDEKAFEALQGLELELIELRDTLLRIAPTYRPNHDDGVQITAAPLWQLFQHKPWQKVLKDTWTKLEKGDYDWAHLAMAYWPDRVRAKCKTDRSLAITHDLEELYEPSSSAVRGKRKKKRGDEG
jgi:hypothetical protein